MKISDAIQKLQTILQSDGDLDVVSIDDVDGFFIVDFAKEFEVFDIPNHDENDFSQVCAFSKNLDNTSPHLKLVKK